MQTPYYCIDESAILKNMEIMDYIHRESGAMPLLALKCFASWSIFPLMSRYMKGTTSSSLYEVRLGKEKFGGETHAYSVAYSDGEIDEVVSYADKIIFNSIAQLDRFSEQSKSTVRGLRVNPGVSVSGFPLADPALPNTRLGERDIEVIAEAIDRYSKSGQAPISGFMIHNNCENSDFKSWQNLLLHAEELYCDLLPKLDWISLGGGIHFTGEGYPLDQFCETVRNFSKRWGVQVYLEPGEASITGGATLETTVLDVMERGKKIAVVDASIEAHMLDLLIYRSQAECNLPKGSNIYDICGKSCLAGDIFGEYALRDDLKVGDRVSFLNAAGYTMVKKNWFNGLAMPSIVVRRLSGELEVVREFNYDDFVGTLS